MKILLLVPPFRTTDKLVHRLYPMPYAAVIIGTVLQQAGHTVTIKDFLVPAVESACPSPTSFAGKGGAPAYRHYGAPLEDCVQWINSNVHAYDVVGVCMGQCNNYSTASEIAQCVKKNKKPLVIGGAYVTTATEQALQLTGADVAVCGEGEEVCVEAFERALRGDHGAVLQGAIIDITRTLIPDWKLAPPSTYPDNEGRVRGVLTISRGCPWGCEFCSVHTVASRKHRRQSAERIEQELRNLWEQGVRYFCFLDDNLFINKAAVDTILGVITKLDAELPGFDKCRFYVEEGMEVRVAAQDGLVARIAAARFDHLAIGLETLNDATRSTMHKPYTAQHLDKAIEQCHTAGITPRAFYIIGFQGDTVESVSHDLVQLGKMGIDIRANNLKLYPGTAVTKQFLEQGIIEKDYDWRLSSWWTPTTTITYAQIRKLKAVLRAIGQAAAELGINIFSDSIGDIKDKFAKHHFTLHTVGNIYTLSGNVNYRPTGYRKMLELIALRFGAHGCKTEVKERTIVARAIAAPADEIQEALYHALHTDEEVGQIKLF